MAKTRRKAPNRLLTDAFREIKNTRSRFISLMVLSALAVCFLAGLRATAPDMKQSADLYFDQQKLMDLRVASTLGLTEQDAEALAAQDGVETLERAYTVDAAYHQTENDYILKVLSYTGDTGLNLPKLVEGRMPENDQECLVEPRLLHDTGLAIGDTLTLDTGTGMFEGALKYDSYTIVGTANSPLYVGIERGSSSLGTGQVAAFVVLPIGAFAMDCYTDFYLQVEGTQELLCYSSRYKDRMDRFKDDLKSFADQRAKLRGEEVVDEANQKIADAEQELADAETKANQKLTDAWAELQDGRRELDSGWRKYRNGQQELSDKVMEASQEIGSAEQELADALANLQTGELELKDGWKEYYDGLAKYYDGLEEYNNGRGEYDNGLREYEEGLKKYEDGKKKLDEGWRQYNQGSADLDAGAQQLEAGRQQLQQQEDAFNATVGGLAGGMGMTNDQLIGALQSNQGGIRDQIDAQAPGTSAGILAGHDAIQAGRQELAQGEAALNSGASELSGAWQQLNQSQKELEKAKKELDDAKKELDEAKEELAKAEQELSDAKKELDDAKQELVDGEQELKDGWQKYNDGLVELADARETLKTETSDARRKLNDALVELNDGEAEYTDGLAEYESGKQEAQQEIADAHKKLEQARRDVADIEACEWYLLDRNTNMGYMSYSMDADRMGNLAGVFPLIFFLVAALVCLTTMTRMVEEQRVAIGGLKALGYSKGAIAIKYVGYGFLASAIGALIGLAVGLTLLPWIICNAWNIIYSLGEIQYGLEPVTSIIAVLAAVGTVTISALAACFSTLTSVPAQLMRPKAPRAGRRVLLERLPFLWKRLSFNHKITTRNLFRYKRRFWMTVIGIGGCAALIVTAFGLRGSIFDVMDRQYSEIYAYTAEVGLVDKVTPGEMREVADVLDRSELVEAWMACRHEMVTAETDTYTVDGFLRVVPGQEALSDFVNLRHRKDDVPVVLPDDGVVLTEKLASLLDVGPGDTLTLDGEKRVEVRVADVTEHYIHHYIYMTENYYRTVFGTASADNLILADFPTDSGEADALERKLVSLDGVTSLSRIVDTRKTFTSSLESVDYAVVLIIVCAAALAFVVLYNLTNINITERMRELATLKVLGFYDGELSAYVYRENVILTFFGVAMGMLMGKLLHRWLVLTVEIDLLMFGRDLSLSSYGYAIILTILFSLVVNLSAHQKLKKLDMVESMKSVE